MNQIFIDSKSRTISKLESVTFLVEKEGVFLIQVVARARGEKQIGGTDDEDLRLELNGRKFPQINNATRLFDSPASFSGGGLHGLSKLVYLVVGLKSGQHSLALISDMSAFLEEIKVIQLSQNIDEQQINIEINQTAEDGERRPWITFALVDAKLTSFTLDLVLQRRFRDSDDVKVIVDGEEKLNYKNGFRKLWYFVASLIIGSQQNITFDVNLNNGLHYLEVWADRSPEIKTITLSDLSSTAQDPETLKDKIRRKAREYNFDPEMILRLVKKESQYKPNAISDKGAKGLFQLTNITIQQIKILGFEVSDPYNIDQNIEGGLIYLTWLYDRYEGQPDQMEKMLAAWNWGLNYFPINEPLDWAEVPDVTIRFINFILGRGEE